MLYTFTTELRQTPLNADLEKLSSSVLLPSTLYYIRIFKYYICSFKDITSYKFTKICLDNGELPVYSSNV